MAYTVIDVSKYNTITNRTSAAAVVDGVLIRAGYRGYGSSGTLVTDNTFETNYNGFVGKTKVGVYWVTQALNTTEAAAEADYVYNLIKSKQIDFPIYLDIEYGNSSHSGRADSLSKSVRTANAIAFCTRIIELGYRGGIYSSDSWYNSQLDTSQLQAKGYSIWVAKYSTTKPQYVTGYDAWQYTDAGSISGISGNCDVSYFYNDVAGWVTTKPDINNYTLSVPTSSFTYTGSEIKCPFSIGSLVAGTDYTYKYSNNINAGTATCTITGCNNYQGTRSFNYTITPLSIESYTLELSGYSFTYTGSAIKPTYSISGLSTDNYSVSYSNNINVGTAKVTATGKGNYAGTVSRTFTITQRSIKLYSMSIPSESYEYTGSAIKPKVTINGLTEGADFTVYYSDNIDIGTATVTATGINNFTNSISTTFRIEKYAIDITKETVTMSYTTTVYNRLPQCPDITVGSLKEDTDYKLELSDNVNVGTVTVKIIGINDYTGTITKTFTITAQSISEYKIDIEKTNYTYTGSAIEPKFSIGILEKDVDYKYEYLNNVNVGTGIINVTATGNYIGYLSTKFDIDQADISNINITLSEYTYTYDGTYKIPNVYIIGLIYNIDYTLKYLNNINAGTASVVATGIGNYKGFKQIDYTITRQSIYDRELVLDKIDFYYNINPIVPSAYITGLRLGSDYKLTYYNNDTVGIAKVIASGINNYQGDISKNFTIHAKKIDECIAKYGYASIKTIYRIMDDKGLRVYIDTTEKLKLTEATDYEITNVVSKDMDDFLLVTFYVKGIGGFCDEAEFRFRMLATEPSEPIDYEDDGVYNFGDINTGDETAYGNYDFKELEDHVDIIYSLSSENDDPEVPDRVKDGEDYDFDAMSGMYTGEYDEDTGTNINPEGEDKRDPEVIVDDDDGTYNFGSIDLQDETAVGDYDFGDLDEGVSEESVANGDYDFNKFAGDSEEWLVPGTEFNLKNTPMYSTYSISTSFELVTATYFIYNSNLANGRVRMARTDAAVEMPGRAAGWCKTVDLLNLGAIVVGDQVKVDGKIYLYSDGSGGTINDHQSIMYVNKILDDAGIEYPYALSNGYKTAIIGYANKDILSRIEPD